MYSPCNKRIVVLQSWVGNPIAFVRHIPQQY